MDELTNSRAVKTILLKTLPYFAFSVFCLFSLYAFSAPQPDEVISNSQTVETQDIGSAPPTDPSAANPANDESLSTTEEESPPTQLPKKKAAGTAATRKTIAPTASAHSSASSIRSTRSQSKEIVTYSSSIDQALSIRNVAVVGIKDNLKGIYSEAITKALKERTKQDLQWSLLEKETAPLGFNEIFDNKKSRELACSSTQADGIVTGRLIRGVAGMSLTIAMISCKDFKILGLQEDREFEKSDTNEVLQKSVFMYEKIKSQLPYTGLILSRKALDVTLNLGTAQGISVGDELNVAQVVSVQRHPKLEFITRFEKVILGKIAITKVDSSGSFAKILLEVEPGVIQTGTKILPKDPVNYGIGKTTQGTVDAEGLQTQSQVFGKNPEEWKPLPKPQYGSLTIVGGLSQYGNSINTVNEGTLNTDQSLAPNVSLSGEAWLSQLWYLFFGTRQSFFSGNNPSATSSPGKLNYYLANYKLGFGYNFLLNDDFWGPKFRAELGYSQFLSVVSENTPVAVTNMQYSGTFVGFAGQFNISPDFPLTLGARFNYFLTNSVEESGKSSGVASGTKNYQFGLYGMYPWTERVGFLGHIDFENYKNDFLGPGDRVGNAATSASHRVLALQFGVNYQF